MSQKVKYPKSFHLPFTEHKTSDDKMLRDVSIFEGKEIVVTEKMDGENTSIYCDCIHARSLETRDHPSRHHVKALFGTIRYFIPEGWRICGENVYAMHSIKYSELTSYFYVFSIIDNKNNWLNWDDTVKKSKEWGLETVPVLYRGKWDDNKVKSCYTGHSAFGGEQEGYVVRSSASFHYSEFHNNLAKFVREGHVQTDEHWLTKPIVPNELRK